MRVILCPNKQYNFWGGDVWGVFSCAVGDWVQLPPFLTLSQNEICFVVMATLHTRS